MSVPTPTQSAPSSAAEIPAPLINPNLTAILRAEYETLLKDLEKARLLAAELQRQLQGKSEEVTELKALFEKAQVDLGHLQKSIMELRHERHRLANEAMRAVAFERRLAEVTAERDRLSSELDLTRQTIALNTEESRRTLQDRDAQLAILVGKVEALQARLGPPCSVVGADEEQPGDPVVNATLAEVWHALEKLQHVLDPKPEPKPDGIPLEDAPASTTG
jgi:hypothetical protein